MWSRDSPQGPAEDSPNLSERVCRTGNRGWLTGAWCLSVQEQAYARRVVVSIELLVWPRKADGHGQPKPGVSSQSGCRQVELKKTQTAQRSKTHFEARRCNWRPPVTFLLCLVMLCCLLMQLPQGVADSAASAANIFPARASDFHSPPKLQEMLRTWL
jgi:hypothetical protein